MAYIQPVQGVDYGKLLMQGLGAYRGVKGMQQQDAMIKAQSEATQRRQRMEDTRFQRQEQEWKQEDKDRFAKDSMLFASEIGDLPLNMQIQKSEERVADLEKRGIDSTETRKLSDMLKSGDNQQVAEAQQAILQRRELGYQTNTIERPPKEAGIKPMSAYGKMAVDMGARPGTPEFLAKVQELRQQDMKKVGTKIDVKVSQKAEDEISKGAGQRYNKALEDGSTARTTMAKTEQLRRLLDAGVKTGKLEGFKKDFLGYMAGLGVSDETIESIKNVPAGEAFQAASQELINEMIANSPGVATDQDEIRFKQANAEISKTPQANRFLINSSQAFAQRKIDKMKFYQSERKGGTHPEDIEIKWQQELETRPFMSKSLVTEHGIPVFYSDYKKIGKKKGYSDEQILEFWKSEDRPVESLANREISGQ